jgi:hypothetical protein
MAARSRRRVRRVAATKRAGRARDAGPLPGSLQELFWDLAPDRLDLRRDRDLVISRVLAAGGWDAARVLRRRIGDDALREWLLRNEARGLSPARLRFWELVLELPKARADAWVRAARASVWGDRHHR